jgi:D-3-phosphoglycerate dehydrogenase
MTLEGKKVLLTDYIWPELEIEERMAGESGFTLVVAPNGEEETLATLAKDVDGIITCFASVTEKVLRAAEKCLVVSRTGVGVDNIHVATATELGMWVAYVPDYCMDEVAEHVMSIVLALNRMLVPFDRTAREKSWGTVPLMVPVMRMSDQVLGIVGLGRIGSAVCRRAKGFGMEVLACDPYLDDGAFDAAGARKVSLDDLLRQSDYVTLHTPLNDETLKLIGERELRLMKPSAYLINCARGPIVDEQALIAALDGKEIAGAGLDVVESPLPASDNPLFKMDNVIVTPHVAFFSQPSLRELRTRTTAALIDVLNGSMPENVFNPEVEGHARTPLRGRDAD